MDTTKRPWQSKTLWLALITAIAAFIPPVQTWIASNPEMFALILGGAFGALRVITKGAVSIQ